MKIKRFIRGNINRFLNWRDRRAEDKRYGHFISWMIRRHGQHRIVAGTHNWRVKGILITIWTPDSSMMKVYHSEGKHALAFDPSNPFQCFRAMEHVIELEDQK